MSIMPTYDGEHLVVTVGLLQVEGAQRRHVTDQIREAERRHAVQALQVQARQILKYTFNP